MDINRVALFLEQLRQAQILDPTQLDQAQRHPLARGEDPVPLAKDLVQKGWLTLYQAKELLQQRAADLVFGPYRVLDLLGEGGMGRVFRACHQTMGRAVALKVIKAEHLESPTAVQRFHQEIRAAAQLTHPNIVTAFDAGQAGAAHFFAMEFVEGADLGRLVKQSGPLSVAASCDYIRQAALGLQHAHERGLVHRDIKPANLLLSRAVSANGLGTIKLLDLGLARMQGPDDQPANGLTRLGTVVGTPEFLAPEQAVNSRKVDIRADLYSLGCTFYYLLTGQPPFRGTSLNDLLLKHAVEAPPPLETFRADVPPAIQNIVRKLLAKRPDERFQTPAELAAALPLVRKKDVAYSAIPTAQVVVPAFEGKSNNSPLGLQLPPAARRGWKRMAVITASVAVLLLVGLVLALGPLAARDQGPAVAQASRPAPISTTTAQTRPPETRPLPTTSTEKPNPTGTWKWTTMFGNQTRETTVKLKLDGDRLTGFMLGRDQREMPLEDPKYKDGALSFKMTRERNGQKSTTTYEGVLSADTIKGKAEDQGGRSRDWEAKRAKD
jgi:serine/threonine-protein kinase